jgi:hypothetical protein
MDGESFFLCDGLQVEMVGEPAKGDEGCSRYGGDSEEDELWVVLCDFADPAMGEGGLMSLDLRDVVDDQEGGDDEIGAEFEEEGWGELADEHVELLLSRYVTKYNKGRNNEVK